MDIPIPIRMKNIDWDRLKKLLEDKKYNTFPYEDGLKVILKGRSNFVQIKRHLTISGQDAGLQYMLLLPKEYGVLVKTRINFLAEALFFLYGMLIMTVGCLVAVFWIEENPPLISSIMTDPLETSVNIFKTYTLVLFIVSFLLFMKLLLFVGITVVGLLRDSRG